MSDNTCERLIALSEVPGLPWLPERRGKKLHIATLYRWAGRGAGGRRLRTWRVGGVLCTTEAALREFFANEAPDAPGPRTPHQRRQAVEQAARELEEAGL